jgi:hypothetical protein
MRGARACISKLFPLFFWWQRKVCSQQPGSALRTKSCDVNMAVKDKHLRRQPHQHTGNFVVVIPQQLVYIENARCRFSSPLFPAPRAPTRCQSDRPANAFFRGTHGFHQIEIEFGIC